MMFIPAPAVIRVGGKKPGSAAALGPCALGTSWRNKSVGETALPCTCYKGLHFLCFYPLCSVPTPMLPTPTPDQAHHSHRAAWDIQLPPSSRHSTRTRRTGTELHPNNVNALLLMLQDRPRSCLPGTRLGPRECTVQPHLQPVRSPRSTPFHRAE